MPIARVSRSLSFIIRCVPGMQFVCMEFYMCILARLGVFLYTPVSPVHITKMASRIARSFFDIRNVTNLIFRGVLMCLCILAEATAVSRHIYIIFLSIFLSLPLFLSPCLSVFLLLSPNSLPSHFGCNTFQKIVSIYTVYDYKNL